MKRFLLLFVCIAIYIAAFAQAPKCSNIVHNTLPPDADNRSPSECEVQFDWKVRTTLRDAFSKTFQHFPSSDWVIADTAVELLTQISKGTEKSFFRLNYNFKIDMAPQSAAYKDWYEKYQAAMQGLKAADEAAYKNFTRFGYRMNNAIHISIFVTVNSVSHSVYFPKGGQQIVTVPGAAFAVKGPNSPGQSKTDDVDACLILFGNQKPSIKKESEGGASLYQLNNFPKNSSYLTVQNISVRIECNNELLNQILKDTDWKSIAYLIGK